MKNLLTNNENNGNLKYRISEKSKAHPDVNIKTLMADVEILYEK